MPKNEKPQVVITIHGAAKMTAATKKKINNWFRVQGRRIISEGDAYAKTFTARYYN